MLEAYRFNHYQVNDLLRMSLKFYREGIANPTLEDLICCSDNKIVWRDILIAYFNYA